MPHIPRAFCLGCTREMVVNKIGALLETHTNIGAYYKIYADIYKCMICGNQIALPADRIVAEHWEEKYDRLNADFDVVFSDFDVFFENI